MFYNLKAIVRITGKISKIVKSNNVDFVTGARMTYDVLKLIRDSH